MKPGHKNIDLYELFKEKKTKPEHKNIDLYELFKENEEITNLISQTKTKKDAEFQYQIVQFLRIFNFGKKSNILRALLNRTYLGKEDSEVLNKFKSQFIYGSNESNELTEEELLQRGPHEHQAKGCIEMGLSEDNANKLWDTIHAGMMYTFIPEQRISFEQFFPLFLHKKNNTK